MREAEADGRKVSQARQEERAQVAVCHGKAGEGITVHSFWLPGNRSTAIHNSRIIHALGNYLGAARCQLATYHVMLILQENFTLLILKYISSNMRGMQKSSASTSIASHLRCRLSGLHVGQGVLSSNRRRRARSQRASRPRQLVAECDHAHRMLKRNKHLFKVE